MDFISSVISANLEIYNLIKYNLDDSFYEYKEIGAGGDRSLKIDLEAESIFIKHLSCFGEILSEESGSIGSGDKKIVIDPIDGSGNFYSNIPYYGTSIALVDSSGDVEIGVVFNITNGDIFVKSKKSFQKSNIENLNFIDVKERESNIGIFEKSYTNSKFVEKLAKLNLKYRTPGALALSLAYSHFVDFTIFLGQMREFDIKAGLFMCEDLNIYRDNDLLIISKNIDIFNKIKNTLL